MASAPNPIQAPAHILGFLDKLHQQSLTQEASLGNYYISSGFDELMRDKFIALDQDKCHFIYQLALAISARNIVEAGTSFGVSTIYLALAVGKNAERTGGDAKVIATEKESSKAAQARKHWEECGDNVTKWIELREGDLLETLKTDLPIVDMLLLDSECFLPFHMMFQENQRWYGVNHPVAVWAPLTLPTLQLVAPKMRSGGVVVIDNSVTSAKRYEELLRYLRAEGSGFTNLTLPYSGGLEFSVKL
jgi:predicted O-methyltransferase YrrM